jgi:hypothetical protein
MTDDCIYGVDLSKKVSPEMVRDAIVDCFTKAHEEILNLMKEYANFKDPAEFEKMKTLSVRALVQKTFHDVGENFDTPTKESILKVIPKLQEFAMNFRQPTIVQKHAGEIMQLVEKL